jgi:hypothetical protein
MDNLSAHAGARVHEIVKSRSRGLVLPAALLAGRQPIQGSFAKGKGLLRRTGARSHETLIEMICWAISAATGREA